MHWYATFHGVPFGFDSYQFQSLEAACKQMEIQIERPLHRAATDARMTAKLILKMAEIAERELPSWRWELINGREKTSGLGNKNPSCS